MTMPYRLYFCTIILLAILLEPRFVETFGKRRCRKRKIIKDMEVENRFYNPLIDSEENCVDPHCSCDNVGFGIVQKIPYLPVPSSCATVNVQFSSACIRCGLCLAIAEQINQTLLDTHDKMRPDQWLNDTEASSILKSICNQAFRHKIQLLEWTKKNMIFLYKNPFVSHLSYSLREIFGKRYICDRIPGATLVPTTADGLWDKNLKDKCNTFLIAYGASNLYKHWQRWSGFDQRLPQLTTILCRGEEGLFRDCKSLPDLSLPELKKDDSFFAKMRVMVEVKCK